MINNLSTHAGLTYGNKAVWGFGNSSGHNEGLFLFSSDAKSIVNRDHYFNQALPSIFRELCTVAISTSPACPQLSILRTRSEIVEIDPATILKIV